MVRWQRRNALTGNDWPWAGIKCVEDNQQMLHIHTMQEWGWIVVLQYISGSVDFRDMGGQQFPGSTTLAIFPYHSPMRKEGIVDQVWYDSSWMEQWMRASLQSVTRSERKHGWERNSPKSCVTRWNRERSEVFKSCWPLSTEGGSSVDSSHFVLDSPRPDCGFLWFCWRCCRPPGSFLSLDLQATAMCPILPHLWHLASLNLQVLASWGFPQGVSNLWNGLWDGLWNGLMEWNIS